MHPWMSNDVAKARSEEKLARGLAAYRALSAREGQAAERRPRGRRRRTPPARRPAAPARGRYAGASPSGELIRMRESSDHKTT